ncbi:MAG: ABC transporter ATP-binding protein [Panacagrimonas sp.]
MLRAEKLGKIYGANAALRDLDLHIRAGDIYCLLGANGAGKTTTINLFLGFVQPSSGSVSVDGINAAIQQVEARARLAYIPEQVNLYPLLSGRENLDYFARLAGVALDRAAGDALFRRAGLEVAAADRRIGGYSKGMRQKVGIAIALAKNAKALLLDEPLSGLDPHAANEFCVQLRSLRESGVAVLMATHDLFRARELGGRIGIMKQGRLVDERDATSVTATELEQLYLTHMQE